MKGIKDLKARSKIWLEIDGSLALGDGKGGGYSQLTKDGEDLLKNYINFRSGINEFVDEKFREYFK